MKLLILKFSFLFFLCSCTNAQNQAIEKLDAQKFKQTYTALDHAQLVDVRTPQEVAKGSIENAININWFDGFETEVSKLDKEKAVFIYCRSGGRSTKAANKLATLGFKEIYELEGGIGKWLAAGFSLKTTEAQTSMSKTTFDRLTNKEGKLVLVDFYAEWCGPCKKMAPYLEEIKKEYADKVVLLKIDADANPDLCKELNITGLPVLQLYKGGQKVWEHLGFIDKAGIVQQLD